MGERRAHAIIDLSALRSNFLRARELSGEREVIAVVKADAYGHGAGPAARSLESVGCRRFAVVSVGEACELREAGVTGGVLVMGGLVSGDEARLVAEYGLCPVVHHDRDLELVREAARIQEGPISVEIEVDTGMQRMGVAIEEAVSLAHAVAGDPATRLAGIFTHFAHAENPEPEASLEQIAAFRALIHELRAAGIDPGCIHAANSSGLHAGAVLSDALPEANAVRPGLMLYGATLASHEDTEREFRPVMSVRTQVAAVRDISVGSSVGYGGTWRAERPTRVATLSIGYADGVLRSLSNRGRVWLAGAERPMVGQVSMDYLSVEIGEAQVEVADPATYFGPPAEGGQGITVEEQAEAADTSAYELLVRVGSRVAREPVDRG